MPISHEHKLVFIHIPKNAGTAITRNEKIKFQMEGHHKWFDHKNLLGKQKWEEYFKFSVVRNPWDRVLSNYKYSRMLKSYWHSTDGTTPYPKHVDYDLCSTLSFEDCIRLLYKNPEKFKHMGWGPQHPYIYNSLEKNIEVDQVFYHHDLDSTDFKKIIPNLGKINVSDGSDTFYINFYNDELINMVGEIYSDDIEIFNMNYKNE